MSNISNIVAMIIATMLAVPFYKVVGRDACLFIILLMIIFSSIKKLSSIKKHKLTNVFIFIHIVFLLMGLEILSYIVFSYSIQNGRLLSLLGNIALCIILIIGMIVNQLSLDYINEIKENRNKKKILDV